MVRDPASRRRLAAALAVLAAAVLTLAVVVRHLDRVLFDADEFADRATATLRDDRVTSLLGERLTDGVVLRAEADLVAARPLVQAVAEGVVGGRAFASLFHAAVRDVHRAVFDRDQDTVALTVADAGVVLAAALRELDPALADQARRSADVEVLRRDVGAATGDLARTAEKVRSVVVALLVAGLLLGAAAIAVAPDRRRTIASLAGGLVVGGVVIVALTVAARAVLTASVDDGAPRDAAGAVWDAFARGLPAAGLTLALVGAIVVAVARARDRPRPAREVLARGFGTVTREPARTPLRVVRGAALVVVGLLVVADPGGAARLTFTLVGLAAVYVGADALLRLVPAAPPEREERRRRSRRSLLWQAARPATAALLVAIVALGFFSAGDDEGEAAPRIGACNGSAALCDRALPEVALVATHNSMSVPEEGWYAALQDADIATQLEEGVRGLLIDTHYADRLDNGRLRTVIEEPPGGQPDALGREARDAAERLRERAGFRGEGERGMYLCHTFCELGATPVADALEAVHTFLVTHPEEVLVVINQDQVRPADFVEAMRAAGLDRMALTPPSAGAWPTLREMIDRDQRLVVLAENEAGEAPWYRLAYDGYVQETPYSFGSSAELTAEDGLAATCRPGRGGERAPLFLLNHWVTTDPLPRPSDAERVNARAALLRRAELCRRRRGRLPNLIAINYHRRGDVPAVVAALNGTG